MSSYIIVASFALVLCIAAAKAGSIGGTAAAGAYRGDEHAHAKPQYQFQYEVHDSHSGDFKNQWEQRDGDVVKGSYSLVEPDGTVRHVEYHSDGHNGFNALVKKIGKAVHSTGPRQ